MAMDYRLFTNDSLQLLHDAVHKAIEADKIALRQHREPPHKTSDTKDWRDHAKGLEREMVARGINFIAAVFT